MREPSLRRALVEACAEAPALLIDIATLSVKASFPCPQTLADGETSIGGPHSVTEKLGHIFASELQLVPDFWKDVLLEMNVSL